LRDGNARRGVNNDSLFLLAIILLLFETRGGLDGSHDGLFLGSGVDEPASDTIGAGSCRVEGFACLGLVLGMPEDGADLLLAMGKLALDAIPACSSLGEGLAQLGFVSILVCEFILDGLSFFCCGCVCGRCRLRQDL